MFEITGNEISELNDSDLRSLVGLLCEADLRINNLPTAGVTCGGNQDAKDGGLDVRVELVTALDPQGFIPRAVTGYQVKKPDMPRSEIIKEMCPKGELRPVIRALADSGGAYIIVSSTGSTTDTALGDRRKAMVEAVGHPDIAAKLKLDFYDRNRLAGWVRCHPSLVLWVREKIGKPFQGWRPFDNWANALCGLQEEYLLDEDLRLHDGTALSSDGLTVVVGINRLRAFLLRPASSIRLVGLSGVGKTRLLQALFDDRVGEKSLNPSQVFYTDLSNSPNPDPRSFAERLIALQRRAILAVDNCPPDLHRSLTSVCTASGSLVSLITVEYDVRDDLPEETTVFRLEPASTNIVLKIVRNRFKHIGDSDARTIAEFSGGNARVAIALANTVLSGETLADLKDEHLFQRLFIQRNEPNNTLLRSAEACSLVYSFDCQTASGSDLELSLLGILANRNVGELYGDVSELKRRDIVQQRNIWRAVLPHALANKLAQRALENIPLDNILKVFVNGGSERLLRSFSKRLSYLHKCEKAIEIADSWLSENGLIGDISKLNELGITLLSNIAPIKPKTTLEAIERAANGESGQEFTSSKNNHFTKFTSLLRSLAYDSALFERCTDLLCRFALSEEPQENNNSVRDLLKSLFYIFLSGTHASVNQRFCVIERLVKSKSENEQNLGLLLFSAALEAEHFIGNYSFDFGAHSRDYGYFPRTSEETHKWYAEFIRLSEVLAVSDQPIANKVKTLLAERFRVLWVKPCMFDELERVAKSIVNKRSWNEGWIAVRTTIRFGGKQMDTEMLSRLHKLEKLLKPESLLEKARTYALSSNRNSLDLVDAEEGDDEKISERYERVGKATKQIGREVAGNDLIFKTLLPEIVSADGPRLYSFAQGLAEGCLEPLIMWQAFRRQLSSVEYAQRNYQVLRGFLSSVKEVNHKLSEQILNDAVTDDVLGVCFPLLQASVEIDEQGVERLKQSLAKGLATIWTYRNLAYGRIHESINDQNLSDLLMIIASKPDGLAVAISILHMRLYSNKEKKLAHSDIIISVGQNLLSVMVFEHEHNHRDRMDYDIGNIADACLVDEGGAVAANILCNNIAKALSEYKIHSINYTHLLESIARRQPQAFLDVLLGDDKIFSYQISRLFIDGLDDKSTPLAQISDDVIIAWCEVNPSKRYPIVAVSVVAYRHGENDNQLEWTPLSLSIIDNAPDVVSVLNELKKTFRPMSWSGSRADILQTRLSLLSSLKSHKNPVVAEWACNEEGKFKEEIRSERKGEEERHRSRDERFE
jgi:hypothetical protein